MSISFGKQAVLGRNKELEVQNAELRTRVAELEAALVERGVPARAEGFKLLAIVEIESDGEGRWEDREGTPFDTDLAFGWLPHPASASGRAFHQVPDESKEVGA